MLLLELLWFFKQTSWGFCGNVLGGRLVERVLHYGSWWQERGDWLFSSWLVQRGKRTVLRIIDNRWLILSILRVIIENILIPLLFLWFIRNSAVSLHLLKILGDESLGIFHRIEFHLILICYCLLFMLASHGWGVLDGDHRGSRWSLAQLNRWVVVQLDRVPVPVWLLSRFVKLEGFPPYSCVSFLPFVFFYHRWHHYLTMHLQVGDKLLFHFTRYRFSWLKIWGECLFKGTAWACWDRVICTQGESKILRSSSLVYWSYNIL